MRIQKFFLKIVFQNNIVNEGMCMNISNMKERCSACAACINICPQHCISFVQNEYGMIQPLVDEKRCIDCNLCSRVCPHFEEIDKKKPRRCLAGYRRDMSEAMDCASGGIAYSLYEKFISEDHYVVGVRLDQNNKAVFCITNKRDEICAFQGSKYVQADIMGLYDDIENILKIGRKILIIALPCQISAMSRFIECKKLPLDNVIFVDCLCHGVSPQKYLDEEIEYFSKKYKWKKIKQITFRSNYQYRDYNLTIFAETANRERVYCAATDIDYYFGGFFEGVSLCESCYNCDYSQVNRVSDITIGDYINVGTNEKYPQYCGKRHNVSIVLCNTQKGLEIISSMSNVLNLFERPLEEAVEQCPALRKPCARPENRKIFMNKYLEGGFIYAAHNTLDEINKGKIKKKLKQIFKQQYLLHTLFRRIVDTVQNRGRNGLK